MTKVFTEDFEKLKEQLASGEKPTAFVSLLEKLNGVQRESANVQAPLYMAKPHRDKDGNLDWTKTAGEAAKEERGKIESKSKYRTKRPTS